MNMPRGTVAYPDRVDPDAIDALATACTDAARAASDVDGWLVAAATGAQRFWHGEAAVTFGDHMFDRAHAFELGGKQLTAAAAALHDLAAGIRASQERYRRAVEQERIGRAYPQPRVPTVPLAVEDQRRAVAALQELGAAHGSTLATIAQQLVDYASRSFVAVGEHIRPQCVDDMSVGQDLIADAVDATEDPTQMRPDEIQVRELSDGTYVVVLPGVTDLQKMKFFGGNPDDLVRKIANAEPTTMVDGAPNPYAEIVKMALRRAGVPSGATVTFVGHSYGAYTSVDLAGDDAFNSADGDSKGYNVRVKRVVAVGADTDWKLQRVPGETDVALVNSRDDSVYQTEAQMDPETDWLWRRDRPALRPMRPYVPLLPSDVVPAVSYPSGRSNQVEYEVNAGRSLDWEDKLSGHHPKHYSNVIRSAGPDSPIASVVNGSGDAVVVRKYNVRVPDRVPVVAPNR